MKPRDYHYEFVRDLPDSKEVIELTIEKKELRDLLDASRDLRAKSNRLATQIESFDQDITYDVLNQWQIAAQVMQFNMSFVIARLCNMQERIINYNRLKADYEKTMESLSHANN